MPSDMSLGQKQRLFCSLLPRLLDFIYESGYECTLGDAFRDPRSHGAQGIQIQDRFGNWVYGRHKSAHKHRLAIDLNLFLDGAYLTTTEEYSLIGEYWESLHELCEWGGHFDDGNHFSMLHDGVK